MSLIDEYLKSILNNYHSNPEHNNLTSILLEVKTKMNSKISVGDKRLIKGTILAIKPNFESDAKENPDDFCEVTCDTINSLFDEIENHASLK